MEIIDIYTGVYSASWVMIYYGAVVWYLPYLFTYLSLKYISASAFGATTAITPVAAALTSVLFFGVHMRIADVIGIVLVIISIIIIGDYDQNDKLELCETQGIP